MVAESDTFLHELVWVCEAALWSLQLRCYWVKSYWVGVCFGWRILHSVEEIWLSLHAVSQQLCVCVCVCVIAY